MEVKRSAPGKVILCGEHSVVYGYPAIAVPVSDVRAVVHIESQKNHKGLEIVASDIGKRFFLSEVQNDNPLAMAVNLVLSTLKIDPPNALMIVHSELPIAAGMGSGAAVTVAIIRALSAYAGQELDNSTINRMTYEVEKIYHGSPSGIDNTVISWERPIYFIKGQPHEFCTIGKPINLLIASSGIISSTRNVVNYVRSRKADNPHNFERIFTLIGNLTNAAKMAITEGDLVTLGELLKINHKLLGEMGVSIPKLDEMVKAAEHAGALGAKLTGSGQGGNIIALVDENHTDMVRNTLYRVGSTSVWHTQISVSQGTSTYPTPMGNTE